MVKVKVKKRKAGRIAYIDHVGEYGDVPYDTYFKQLYSWAKENKVRPGFKPLGIFRDDPESTPPGECRCEIGILIVGEARSSEEIKVKDMPEMDVAIIKHSAPAEEYTKTYGELSKWIEENGYEWAGPAIEVYGKKPKVKGGKTIVYAEIQVPVRKK